MDYAALKAEIVKADYVGLKDDALAAALNAKTMTVPRPIPAADVKKFFIKTSVLARAKFFAADPAGDLALRAACQTVYDGLLYDAFIDLDPSDPEQGALIKGFLDALQQAGCLDDDGRKAVLALANVAGSPFVSAVLFAADSPARPVTIDDIAKARAS